MACQQTTPQWQDKLLLAMGVEQAIARQRSVGPKWLPYGIVKDYWRVQVYLAKCSSNRCTMAKASASRDFPLGFGPCGMWSWTNIASSTPSGSYRRTS